MKKKPSDLTKILSFISLRPRSEKEVRDRLVSYHATDIDSLITELKNNQLINDRFFAQWLIDSRTHSKPRSLLHLKQELKLKGISESLILELLSPSVEDESLANLIRKKSRTLSREKLLIFLSHRGFPYAKVQAKLDEMGISE